MRSERGQASVEWIGLVLLLALGLTALVRFTPRADPRALGGEFVHALTCAAYGGCEEERNGRAGSGAPAPDGSDRLVVPPPLVPVPPGERRSFRQGRPRGRAWLRAPRSAGPFLRRAGRRAGTLWRRGWLLCLGYERVRWSVLHPEIRFPHQTIPVSEDLRIANDCLSPVDLVRDRDLLRGGP
ncbi:MAG TPA: hypothetical protein VF056_03185 [Thermoleophilaceae bacterium]